MELKSILGLLIAAAIPVVILALWAEYFKQELTVEDTGDLEDEEDLTTARLARIRFAGLLATALQLVVFLSTAPVREENPTSGIAGLLITLAALVAQRAIQLQLERKNLPAIEPGSSQPEQQLFPSGLFWAFTGMLIYFGVLSGCVLISAVAVAVFRLEGALALSVIGAGGVMGYSAALACNFALSPWLFRKMIPSREIQDPRLINTLSECFGCATLSAPEFREIPSGTVKSANAWVTGFAGMTGVFRPVLWITPRLKEEFLRGGFDQEFQAIIKHEVAHMKLRHLARRFVLAWSMSLVILITVAAALGINAYFRSQQITSIIPLFSLASAAALLWTSLQLARRQARTQELEADLYAVKQLGASATSLIHALKSIEEWNAPLEGRTQGEAAPALGSHPASADRIAALQPLADREDLQSSQDRRAA